MSSQISHHPKLKFRPKLKDSPQKRSSLIASQNRLLAVPGVRNIVIFGGAERQYQVLINPESLKAFNVSLDEVKIRLLLQIKTHRGDF